MWDVYPTAGSFRLALHASRLANARLISALAILQAANLTLLYSLLLPDSPANWTGF